MNPTRTKQPEKVLCVDDEPAVLEGLRLQLRRSCDVVTAPGAMAALDILGKDSSIAVILSDMRMPGMNGAAFLSYSRKLVPDATRMLLTGQADIDSAIAAINEGQIFRFLSKPCSADVLLSSVDAAIVQHRLVTAERVLLEQTLHGSVNALAEVLALSKPELFGRANRIKKHVSAMVTALKLPNRWEIEVAAMLSPLGSIILPDHTAAKIRAGADLTEQENAMSARVPHVTEQLLAKIPRLEGVREILSEHTRPYKHNTSMSIGARLLRIALDFDILESRGATPNFALDTMRGRTDYDMNLLATFQELFGSVEQRPVVKELPASAIRIGMVLASDVHLQTGVVLVSRGFEVTESFLERLSNFPRGMIREPIRVQMPPES